MVFDKTDTKLSEFITQASTNDLTGIASQVFGRVASLDEGEQERFIQQVSRDPQTKRLFERMQTYSR
jgi:hypothetical protein